MTLNFGPCPVIQGGRAVESLLKIESN